MTILGILIGIAIIAGLIFAMGKMSEQGVDINDHFCCGHGSCSECSVSNDQAESCTYYDDLQQLHLNGSGKETR